MRKICSLLLLSVSVGGTLFARQVDAEVAKTVAKNFLARKAGTNLVVNLQNTLSLQSGDGIAFNAYYIFSLDNTPGFVVVSADDIVQPILAYSLANEFQLGQNASPETKYWMQLYEKQIAYMVEHNATATEEVTLQWQVLDGRGGNLPGRPTNEVEPLLTTTWNQGTYYDLYTPGTGNNKTPVGCVATAMAQIMKYWNYPATGTGSYSYNSQQYGTLSADFGATAYQWSLMPDNLTLTSLTSSKEAVSELGYHCAIAVRMSFSPTASGSQVAALRPGSKSAETALIENFGYKNTLSAVYRDYYSDSEWLTMLKNEVDQSRPILYAGYGDLGGHAFIFDGYDENNMFHINWGWGGMADGYYTVNNLQPTSVGIGGGNGNFNAGQHALIRIEPESSSPVILKSLKLSMAEDLAISDNVINQGEGFTITAPIRNFSELDYVGGYFRADIYRSDSTFVTFFSRMQNQTLLKDSSGTVSFTTSGLNGLNGGHYFIKISYTGLNSDWIPFAESEGFRNRIELEVIGDVSTGIDNGAIMDKMISIYPNPAGEKIFIDISGISSKVNAIQMFNIQGQSVASETAVSQPVVEIPVYHLSPGIYYVRLATEAGLYTRKVIVKH